MSRATVDLQGVRFFLGYGLIFFFQHVFTVVGVAIVVFFISWKLALIALAFAPVLVAVAYRYSHVSHPVLRDVQQKMADVATVAEENIVGVHVVKSFAQEQAEQDKFERRSEQVFEQSVRANRQRAFYVPLPRFLPLLAQAAVLLVGGRMVAHGSLSIGEFVALQPLPRDARDAAAHARHVDRPGAAGDRVGRADLPGDRRAGGHRRRARRASSCRPGTGRVALRGRHVRLRPRRGRCSQDVDAGARRRPDRRADRAHRLRARRRSRRSSRASTTCSGPRARSTAPTSAT